VLAHLPSATDLLFLAISGVGGYIWSPKANANGARNVTYDNLTRCQRGDVVFSYANGRISQLGLGVCCR
jgi:hypothetical protein